MRKPKNPLKAEPFQGIQDADRGFLVARPSFAGRTLHGLARYPSKTAAEKGIMLKHGRLVRWI